MCEMSDFIGSGEEVNKSRIDLINSAIKTLDKMQDVLVTTKLSLTAIENSMQNQKHALELLLDDYLPF